MSCPQANMENCDRKRKCLSGPCEGSVYSLSDLDQCLAGEVFSESTCECIATGGAYRLCTSTVATVPPAGGGNTPLNTGYTCAYYSLADPYFSDGLLVVPGIKGTYPSGQYFEEGSYQPAGKACGSGGPDDASDGGPYLFWGFQVSSTSADWTGRCVQNGDIYDISSFPYTGVNYTTSARVSDGSNTCVQTQGVRALSNVGGYLKCNPDGASSFTTSYVNTYYGPGQYSDYFDYDESDGMSFPGGDNEIMWGPMLPPNLPGPQP